MQPDTASPHSWQEFIWLTVVGLLGYGSSYLPALFRKKQTDAETARTQAETRQIDLNTTLHAGDMMLDLIKASGVAALDAERLRKEKEYWQSRAIEAEKARST